MITLAGNGFAATPATGIPAAHFNASKMSEVSPPHLPSTRTGNTITSRPTPAMPTALFVAAPIRPAVCVPCHELLPTSLATQPRTTPTSAAVTPSPGSVGSASRPPPSFAAPASVTKS